MKKFLLCVFALAIVLPLQAATRSTRELTEVAMNIARQPSVNWKNYRFLSFGNMGEKKDATKTAIRGMLATMNTTNNSLSKVIVELGPNIWGIDTTKVNWPANAWEDMSKEWVYYTSVPESLKSYLKSKTGSEFPVMRADVFIHDGWNSRWYTQFMQLPTTKDGMLAKLKIDLNKPVGIGVVAEKLTVTQHPGKVARYETPDGKRVWVRMNYENTRGQNDSRKFPTNTDCHYVEFMFELPNGLDGFASYDGDTGKLSRFSDTRISADREGHAVELGQSCFQCHGKGPKLLDHIDDPSLLTLNGSKKYYDKDFLSQTVKIDKKRWMNSMQAETGETAEEVSKATTVVNNHFRSNVGFDDVVTEIGVSPELLKNKLSLAKNKEIVAFSSGDKDWSRAKFEEHFPTILSLFRSEDEQYIRKYLR